MISRYLYKVNNEMFLMHLNVAKLVLSKQRRYMYVLLE